MMNCLRKQRRFHGKNICRQMEDLGKKYKAVGISLAYHNHTAEFKHEPTTGKTFMDIFLENCDPVYVKMQPDMAWVTRGGEDLLAFVERHKNRIEVFHAKDITDKGILCAVGSGCVKILEALAIVPKAKIVVEQDGELNDEKWKALEQSAAFLHKHLD